jgi:putative aldouronate transport system permease protein
LVRRDAIVSVIKPTKGENIFKGFNYIFQTLLSLTFIVPFLIVLSTSFVSEEVFCERYYIR